MKNQKVIYIKNLMNYYVNKFVNQFFESKNLCEYANNKKEWSKEEKKQFKSGIFSCLRCIKKDLLRIDNKYESSEIFHDLINLHKPHILRKNKFTKNSVDYDICANPIDYLKSLFYMNKELEKLNNERIQENKDQIKLFQVISQRTSIKPNYICIDTASLI